MKIGVINQVNYNKIVKTSFKKTNNATPSINNQQLTTPTPSQMQGFFGVRFRGERDIQDLPNNRTSDKNFSSKEQKSSTSGTLKLETIEAFSKILTESFFIFFVTCTYVSIVVDNLECPSLC